MLHLQRGYKAVPGSRRIYHKLIKVRKPARMVLLPEIIKLRYLGGARGKYDVILLFHSAKVGFIKRRIKDGDLTGNPRCDEPYLVFDFFRFITVIISHAGGTLVYFDFNLYFTFVSFFYDAIL